VANRRARGQGARGLWLHAAWRAAALVFLGIFLRSIHRPMTYFTFEDVLSQIGLGYLFLFLLAWRRPRAQAAAAALILIGYWAAFALHPAPGPDYDFQSVGVPADWPHHQTGFAAHWDKNSNFAAAADQWFLNLFPREQPFVFNGGGYLTLSFIPSLATMILGLLAGELLRGGRSQQEKLKLLAVAGVAGIAAGLLLGVSGICPIVKRIWTPSWTLYSGGWACLFLAGFYWAIDMRGKASRFDLFRVVGMNSIAMYTMYHLWDRFLISSLEIHLGWNLLAGLSGAWLEFSLRFGALLILIYFCIWMDRRKLYLRI
jgi:predicted acyltransferase